VATDRSFGSAVALAICILVLCAEYDALPRIGHACGHNIIRGAAAGAAIALGDLPMIGNNDHGNGHPAEEVGDGEGRFPT